MEPLREHDPRQVGRYRLEARLGSGGMGQVFLGFSPGGRPVAVKVVHPELARDEAFLRRFGQEVAAAKRVSGAYTAPVVDAGGGDLPWLATTLVIGPSLADAVDELGPLPEAAVWRLAGGLAEALADVHSCGLIHRDLKPSNVLLAADGPRVIDFGISRALDATGLTGTGMVVGTPSFMSPEQATGRPVGPASDVFSFGGVLAFAATGSGPFGEGTLAVLIYRVVHEEPMLAGLVPALGGLVARCLAKRPEDRPTLAELTEIIAANVEPVRSATAFWPPTLAGFIGSYQARLATSPGAGPAEPAPLPAPAPVSPPAPEPMPPSAPVLTPPGRIRDHPSTITPQPQHARTSPPGPTPAPPGLAPARRRRRRGALVAGIGTAAAAVVAVAVVLATSPSSGPPSGLQTGTGTSGPATSASAPGSSAAVTQPGSVGMIPAAGTPSGTAGTLTYALAAGAVPNWILPMPTSSTNSVYNVFNFEWQMWPPMYYAPDGSTPTIDPTLSVANPPNVVQRRQDDDHHAEALEVEHRPDHQLAGRGVYLRHDQGRGQGVPGELGGLRARLLPGHRFQHVGAERQHGRGQPVQGGQPDLDGIRHPRVRPDHAQLRVGEGLRERVDPRLHQPGQRGQDLRFPDRGVQVGVHLRDQPAVADRLRTVQAERVQRHHRRVHHGAEHHLQRAARQPDVHLLGRAVHLERGGVERGQDRVGRLRLRPAGGRAAAVAAEGARLQLLRPAGLR